MRRFRLVSLALLAPALLVFATIGCGKKADEEVGGGGGGGKKTPPSKKAAETAGGPKTAVEGKGVASLVGTVTFDGTPPADDPGILKAMKEHKTDAARCTDEKADKSDPKNWHVNPDNKGVANVVIFVKPPDGKFFKPGDTDAWKPKDVVVDQPYCAFEPHVSVAFPSYPTDKEAEHGTGQKVIVKNSAPMLHNTKWSGGLKNGGANLAIPSGKEEVLKVVADNKTPIHLECNAHPWMSGYVWVLDTPYAAVTDKDGKFKIEGIPADAEVMVVKWAEIPKFLNGQAGEKMTLKEGENKLDFSVKGK